MAKRTKEIEERIEKFDKKLKDIIVIVVLGPRLGPIIHGPGWTSVAEEALVINALDSLTQRLDALVAESDKLVHAALLVGNGTR